jgi:hypothetical protein
MHKKCPSLPPNLWLVTACDKRDAAEVTKDLNGLITQHHPGRKGGDVTTAAEVRETLAILPLIFLFLVVVIVFCRREGCFVWGFCGTGIWTQIFTLARQAQYHLSFSSRQFSSGYFGGRVLLFPRLAWAAVLLFLPIAGTTGARHHSQLFSTEIVSHTVFLPGLSWYLWSSWSQPPK